jgi:hypothetical protein
MLSGCFPVYYTYWAPAAQGGSLFHDPVSAIGPSDTVEFSFNGIRINFSGNGTGVGMALFIPNGRVVTFLSDTAEFHLPSLTKIKFDVSSTDATTFERLPFSPTGTLTRKLYVASIQFGEPERVRYRIKLPAIKIDDQTYEIPEIEFTKKKGFGVFGM